MSGLEQELVSIDMKLDQSAIQLYLFGASTALGCTRLALCVSLITESVQCSLSAISKVSVVVLEEEELALGTQQDVRCQRAVSKKTAPARAGDAAQCENLG